MASEALGQDNILYTLDNPNDEVPHQMYTCTKCGWRMNFTICQDKANHFRHHPGANIFGIKCEDLSKHKDAWEKSDQSEALRIFCKESAVNKELWIGIQELVRAQFTKTRVEYQDRIEDLEYELDEIKDRKNKWKATAKELEEVIKHKEQEIKRLGNGEKEKVYIPCNINRYDMPK